jgi:hypothetical protein
VAFEEERTMALNNQLFWWINKSMLTVNGEN